RHNLRFISSGFAVTKHAVTSNSEGGDAHVRWDAPREAESGWPARSIPLEYCVCHRLQLCGTSAGSSDWRTVWASFDSSFGRYSRGCEIRFGPAVGASGHNRRSEPGRAGDYAATFGDPPPFRICYA